MRINVSEAYREEFEVFISEYRKFCDSIIDLVVKTVPINKLFAYCRRNHPDVTPWLTGAVLSRDIMKGILEKCSITNITPLVKVIQHCNITVEGKGMIEEYQRSLNEYLLKLRVRYLLGSSKDIVNAKTIIFILDWTPDEASFPHINRLLYETFYHLDKKIIVQDIGKKILHLLNYYNYTATTVPLLHVSCYGYFNLIHCFQFYTHINTHTYTCVSISLLFYVV